MKEDDLLQRIRGFVEASDSSVACPPTTAAAVAAFEASLGLRLPRLYARLLTEVGNGGFGPGYRIMGIPPDGYVDSDLGAVDLGAAYRERRTCDDPAWRTPEGLLFLCHWGCGIFSYVDTLSAGAAVVTDDALPERIEYVETSSSLAGWLTDWIEGVNLWEAMHEVVGYRDGVNPFTHKPHRFPVTRLRGRRLDLEDRR